MAFAGWLTSPKLRNSVTCVCLFHSHFQLPSLSTSFCACAAPPNLPWRKLSELPLMRSFSNTVDSTTFTPVAKWAHNQLERQFPSSVPWHIGGLRVRFDSTWCGSVGEGDDAVTLLSLIYIQLVSSLYVPFPSKIQLSNQRGFSLYLGRFYSGKNQLHSVYLRRSKNDFHDIIGAFFFVPRLLFKKYRCIFIYANRAA